MHLQGLEFEVMEALGDNTEDMRVPLRELNDFYVIEFLMAQAADESNSETYRAFCREAYRQVLNHLVAA